MKAFKSDTGIESVLPAGLSGPSPALREARHEFLRVITNGSTGKFE